MNVLVVFVCFLLYVCLVVCYGGFWFNFLLVFVYVSYLICLLFFVCFRAFMLLLFKTVCVAGFQSVAFVYDMVFGLVKEGNHFSVRENNNEQQHICSK